MEKIDKQLADDYSVKLTNFIVDELLGRETNAKEIASILGALGKVSASVVAVAESDDIFPMEEGVRLMLNNFLSCTKQMAHANGISVVFEDFEVQSD